MMRHLLQLSNLEQGHHGHHFRSDGSFLTFAEKSKGKTGADEKNDKWVTDALRSWRDEGRVMVEVR